MNILLSDEFKTKLGTIKTWIESSSNNLIVAKDGNLLTTKNYQIRLESFELPNETQYNSYSLPQKVESLIAWRWFIEKIGNVNEQLAIFCQLVNAQSDTSWDYSSGECLDAVEIENQTYRLHIGTEDAEFLQYRACQNDWMPKRFESLLGWQENEKKYSEYFLSKYIDFGFKINIPNLLKNEKIYFHFLVAINPIKQSQEDLEEIDVSTWLAVDRSKRYLDNMT
ncbi:MAG: hypothetical protein ACRC1Z_25615, partial [Waterburya sp.]